MKKQRLFFPDLLRVVAAFLVVLIHVTSVGIHDGAVGSVLWCICTALNSISRWSVPVFFMVSGMFLLNPEHDLPLEKLYRKNIARIVLCIVVWGFFYSLLDQYQYGGLSWRSPILAVYGILTDNTGYHLWFLYTLLALYIATPTLRILTAHASRQQLEYALAVWFLFCVCIGGANRMAEAFLDIKGFFPDNAVFLVGSAGYYLMGYYLHRYPIPERRIPGLYILGGTCLLFMSILNVFVPPLWTDVSFSDWMGFGSCTVAVAAFVLASRTREAMLPEGFRRAICWLSDRSFGIYLIHVFLVALIFQIWKLDLLSSLPLAGVLGSTLFIFLLSAWVAGLMQRLPLTKKLV